MTPTSARFSLLVGAAITFKAIAFAAMPFAAPAALAQQSDSKTTPPRAKAVKSQGAQKPKPVTRRPTTPCSEYGAGFVRMAGSDTCVKIGGGIDAGVGFSR